MQPHRWPLCPSIALPALPAHTAKVILQRGRSNPETPWLNPCSVSLFPSAMVSKLLLEMSPNCSAGHMEHGRPFI